MTCPHTDPALNQTFIEDIRHFIWDRTISDNEIEMDLAFSDEEIANAKRYAAMSFNAIRPFSITMYEGSLPNTIWALHGATYHLLLSKLHKESRNDITYNAGGVTAESTKTLVNHLKDQIKLHKAEFESMVHAYKLNINIEAAYNSQVG